MVGEPRSMLLVGPDSDVNALEQLLAGDGWRVTRSATAEEAAERARREKPTALVFRGAAAEGLAMARKLRCCARTALLPALVISEAPAPMREELARWGVKDILDPSTPDRRIVTAVRGLAPLPATPQAPDAELGRPERMRALERTGLLDSPPVAPFDRLARLTAELLDVPVVLMTIVDRQRQFFKAQVGVPEPISTARQTPLSHSFCQWVVTAHEELVVEDARRDPLLCANGATLEMGVVAYAGVPLRAESSDETIGAFCAIDMKPRQWDARELRALHDVASVAEGLTALQEAARLPPLTLDDFRVMAGAAGRAVEATMRLHEAGKSKLAADDQHALVAIASDVGRQLARVAANRRAG